MRRARHVAVVGGGVAGLDAAHVLAARDHVTLFGTENCLGGHPDTHALPGVSSALMIDTGLGLRLAGHIRGRNAGRGQDPR